MFLFYEKGLDRRDAPDGILVIALPVNDVIERDWLAIGIKVNLLTKLICEVHSLYIIK